MTCDFPGGGGGFGPPNLLWIRMWGRLTPLFAYRTMVYQNLNKTKKYHPTTNNEKKNYFLLVEIASADPKGGSGGPDPPGKSQVIWVSIGYKQLNPPPPDEKSRIYAWKARCTRDSMVFIY